MRYIVTVLIAGLLACSAWAEIINGSFETGDFTGWVLQEVKGDAQVVLGGTHGSYMASWSLRGSYVFRDGEWLFSPALVTLAQQVDLSPTDGSLLFDAWVSGSCTISVYATSGDVPDLVITGTAPVTYVIPLAEWEGTGVYAGFVGEDYDEGDNHAYLDNIRIVEIPEPGSLALLGCGLGGVIPLTRRQKR